MTGHGVPVLTKGNPSKVDITLTYRPDLLKGAVTGQITGVGITPSPAAYAMTVLVDPSTGDSLGIQVQTVDDGLPIAFSVAYAITDIKPTRTTSSRPRSATTERPGGTPPASRSSRTATPSRASRSS